MEEAIWITYHVTLSCLHHSYATDDSRWLLSLKVDVVLTCEDLFSAVNEWAMYGYLTCAPVRID
jgi:hypothetical protein